MTDTRVTIEISSLPGLENAIRRCRPGYIISITDPDSEESLQAKAILSKAPCLYARLNFHDIETPAPEFRMPSKEIIASALVILDRINIGNRPLLIQCNAGISRSPAIALLVKCYMEMRSDDFSPADARDLVDEIDEAFGPVAPNMAVMDIGAELLGKHGEAMRDRVTELCLETSERKVDPQGIW